MPNSLILIYKALKTFKYHIRKFKTETKQSNNVMGNNFDLFSNSHQIKIISYDCLPNSEQFKIFLCTILYLILSGPSANLPRKPTMF